MANLDSKVRDWLRTNSPGLITASGPDTVIATAHAKFCASASVVFPIKDFEAALWRLGFATVSDARGSRLALPESVRS